MKKRVVLVLTLVVAIISTNMNFAFAANAETVGNKTTIEANGDVSPKIQIDEITMISPKMRNTISTHEYETTDSTAVKLREYMVKRQGTIEMKIKSENYNSEEVIMQVFEKAFAETDIGNEGDYLYKSLKSYEVNGKVSLINGIYYYNLNANVVYYTTNEQEEELSKKIDSTIKSFAFTSTTTEYEKVKMIYDYICNNVDYDYDNLEDESYTLKFTAYAAMINKTAVCQGYATLLYRMLKNVGISSRYISGMTSGGSHGWNIIKIGDFYYNADSTWDSEYDEYYNEYRYFLTSNANFSGHQRDEQYKTEEFNKKYNMNNMDYQDYIINSEQTTTFKEETTSAKVEETTTQDIASTQAPDNVEVTTKPDVQTTTNLIREENKKKIVVPKAKIKAVKNKKITIKKISKISGYEVRYSKKKSMSKSRIFKKKSNIFIIKSLKKGKNYYLKCRAYKIVSGKKYYGRWSKIKRVRI